MRNFVLYLLSIDVTLFFKQSAVIHVHKRFPEFSVKIPVYPPGTDQKQINFNRQTCV